MHCPKCGRRIRFNERENVCQKCGAWLLTRPPSQHELAEMSRAQNRDAWLNDFPFFGGAPGRRARDFTALWVMALVGCALGIILSFITLHIVLGVVLIIVTALVGSLPTLFLVGSRI